MMRRYSVIYAFTLFYSITCIGQEKNEPIQEIGLTTIVRANQGNSYITFPTDIGNIEPLWFEANLIPNFYVRVREDSRLMGVFTPQIIIRMYQEVSFPVRTPSYIPQMTVYYLLNSKTKANSLSLFGKLAHHSNGQAGGFYLENEEINLNAGNFATNYGELGLLKTRYNSRFNAIQFFGTSMEIYPSKLSTEELHGIYGRYRWNTIFSIFKIPSSDKLKRKKQAGISIKGETTWMFGELNNWDQFSFNRLKLSLTFYYHPKFLEDIGLFAQIYHGMDYYNIYFSHQINVFRLGFMTEKLRF